MINNQNLNHPQMIFESMENNDFWRVINDLKQFIDIFRKSGPSDDSDNISIRSFIGSDEKPDPQHKRNDEVNDVPIGTHPESLSPNPVNIVSYEQQPNSAEFFTANNFKSLSDGFEKVEYKKLNLTEVAELICRDSEGKQVRFNDMFEVKGKSEMRKFYIMRRGCNTFLSITLRKKIVTSIIEINWVESDDVKFRPENGGLSKTIFKNNLGQYLPIPESKMKKEGQI